jgi:hypothetical protein
VELSAGLCELTRQANCEVEEPSGVSDAVGVGDGTVEVGKMNMNVGEGVSEGGSVLVGNEVTVGVSDGGIISAVWVAAASEVNTMAVLTEFGSKTGRGVDIGAKVGRVGAQARINAATIKNENIL